MNGAPNQTNRWYAISMHVWEKKPFETSSSLKKSPLSILLTKDLHIIEKQNDHNKKKYYAKFWFYFENKNRTTEKEMEWIPKTTHK